MDKQNRLLTFLALALLIGVAFLVLDPRRDKPHEDPGDGPPTHALFTYAAKDITGLSLARGGSSLSFEKKGDTWGATGDVRFTIDQRKVTEIVDRFATLKVEERDLKGPDAEFGLDDAQRVDVTLTNAEGKAWRVWVGADTTVGYRTYIRETTNGPVQLASSKIGDLVHRTIADFRSKDVWTFSTATAKRIQFDANGVSVVLRKDTHGWWLGDLGPRADEDAVRNWLYAVESLRAETFLDDVDPAMMGLAPPAATITIEDDTGTHTLKLAGPDVAGGRLALGASGVVQLTPDAADPVKLDGWLSPRLMPIRRIQIDRVSIDLGATKAEFTRKDGVWSDANGNPAIAVDGLLDRIDAVSPDRRTEQPRPATVWGKITIAEGEQREEVVAFGPAVDGRHAAVDLGGGPGFSVAAADLAAVAAAVPALLPPPPAEPATPEEAPEAPEAPAP